MFYVLGSARVNKYVMLCACKGYSVNITRCKNGLVAKVIKACPVSF